MTLNELQSIYAKPGSVESLLVRPARAGGVKILDQVTALEDVGLQEDHYQNSGGNRQVTLIQAEHLEVVASLLGVSKVPHELTRRNIVVRGINLLSLKGKRFKIGAAILEYSGECHPCSRMEKNLGPGAYNAMRGHGGITAKVVIGGLIKLGDPVTVEQNAPDANASQP
jgi:MOSC domain-containing protein YiiM